MEVNYKANKSAEIYPTMRAYVKDFGGTGYYTASAWIQIITERFYSSLQDDMPSEETVLYSHRAP